MGIPIFPSIFQTLLCIPAYLQVILHISGIKPASFWGFLGPLTGSGHLPPLIGRVSLTRLIDSPCLEPGPSQGLWSMRTIHFWLPSSEDWGGLWRQMYQTVREPVSKSTDPAASFTQMSSPKFSKSSHSRCAHEADFKQRHLTFIFCISGKWLTVDSEFSKSLNILILRIGSADHLSFPFYSINLREWSHPQKIRPSRAEFIWVPCVLSWCPAESLKHLNGWIYQPRTRSWALALSRRAGLFY